MPKTTTTIIWTLIFELYVVWCGSKHWHKCDICLKDTGFCAPRNMITIMGLKFNKIGVGLVGEASLYDHLINTRILTLIMDKRMNPSSKNYEANGYMHDLDVLIIMRCCVFHFL